MVERSASHGAMPPLHRRDREESFLVVAGEVTFYVGADSVSARAGDVVVAPPGAARSFRVESDTARWLVLTGVESLDRFRDFARAVATPDERRVGAADETPGAWPCPAERASLEAIARANGIELLGPPGLLPR